MRPSPQSTLLELFPANTFVRDRELAVRSVGLQYRALRSTRYVWYLRIISAIVDALLDAVHLARNYQWQYPPKTTTLYPSTWTP